MVLFIDILLSGFQLLALYRHSLFFNLKASYSLNNIKEFIINPYDVTVHFSPPPRKLSSISIEKWRFDIITVFLKSGGVVDIRSGCFADGRNVFLIGSFSVARLSDRP